MAINKKYLAPFIEEGVYHVYNRTNNKELLFRSEENKRYFLNQFFKFLHPFSDTYCWCLLPNHFHILIRIKQKEEIDSHLKVIPFENLKPAERKYLEMQGCDELMTNAFHRFFTSYSMAFNKMYNRRGNLFHRPFKKVEVIKDVHFTQAIVYIHANPVKHGLTNDFTSYKWSSWQAILSGVSTNLQREECIDWFGGREQFIKAHIDLTSYYYTSEIAIEE